jgi:hypothetical protein
LWSHGRHSITLHCNALEIFPLVANITARKLPYLHRAWQVSFCDEDGGRRLLSIGVVSTNPDETAARWRLRVSPPSLGRGACGLVRSHAPKDSAGPGNAKVGHGLGGAGYPDPVEMIEPLSLERKNQVGKDVVAYEYN